MPAAASAFAATSTRSIRSPGTFPARSIARTSRITLRTARFKPADTLRAEFAALIGGRPADTVVHSCGSGVSACDNLLAMEHAGLGRARLYRGIVERVVCRSRASRSARGRLTPRANPFRAPPRKRPRRGA